MVIVRKTGALADEAGDEGPGGAGEPVGKAKQPAELRWSIKMAKEG